MSAISNKRKETPSPSQVAIEISSIFDDVTTNNLKYCCICLRTEEERKLVEPVHFTKCLHIMKIYMPVMSICYVCEAESTRAFALFQAINFASIINQWFKDIASKLKNKSEIPAYVDKHIAKQRRSGKCWPLPVWWRRVRARCDLVQTEVLVVSDSVPAEAEDIAELTPIQQPAPGRPPPAQPATRNTAPESDSIVIIDDEDDPLEICAPPPLKPAPKTARKTSVVTPQKERGTPTMVPLERLLENQNFPLLASNNVIITQNTDSNINGFIFRPLVLGPDGNYHMTNDSTPMQNKQVMDKVMISENADSDQNFNISTVRALEGDGDDKKAQVVKRPVMSGRIDWEDKIPMDVISFVDATDPTIQTEPAPPIPERKRPRLVNGVIDLC